jgi:hypothetical protein
MPKLCPFDYAVIRVVPRVEREEFINVGVIVCCQERQFLKAVIELDRERLNAFAPHLDFESVRQYLDTIPIICSGDKEAGVIGQLPPRARFDWLAAPRSTIIQVSPVHSGLCADPEIELEDLLKKMVRSCR